MVISLSRSFRRRASHRSAFALVDVIIASVILAIGLAAAISLSGRAIRSAQQGEELATAARLADEQLNLVLARGPDDYAKRFPIAGSCDEPFSQYSFHLDFSGGSSPADPYRVRVTIRWGQQLSTRATSTSPRADDPDARSLSISTLIAPRQIGADIDPDPDRRPAAPIQRGAR